MPRQTRWRRASQKILRALEATRSGCNSPHSRAGYCVVAPVCYDAIAFPHFPANLLRFAGPPENRVSRGGDPLRLYEIMVIIVPSIDDGEVKKELKRLNAVLDERGAKVVKTDDWGRRRFAYELNHEIEGYYSVIEVEGDAAAMDEYARVANLSDKVLRHKIVRLPQPATSAS